MTYPLRVVIVTCFHHLFRSISEMSVKDLVILQALWLATQPH
jgi:hypothetical protein